MRAHGFGGDQTTCLSSLLQYFPIAASSVTVALLDRAAALARSGSWRCRSVAPPADSSTPNADATSKPPEADPAAVRARAQAWAVMQAWAQTRAVRSRAHRFLDLREPGLRGVHRCSCRRYRCGRTERHSQAEHRNRCSQRDAGQHASSICHVHAPLCSLLRNVAQHS